MPSTVNCVVCFEKATCFGGHVHAKKEIIIAGFCKAHFRTQHHKEGCKGCYGNWKEEMGVDKSVGATVMYIDKDGIHPIKDKS